MTYPMTEDGPSYDDDGVLDLYPEIWRTPREYEIMSAVEDLTRVRDRREALLTVTQEEILNHAEAIARLEERAAKWELGIGAVEDQIDGLLALLDEPPLDMSPTGEDGDSGTDSVADWAEAGYTVAELPVD